MTAAAQLLDAVVPIVRTRLPRGVDIDYLDDFVARNRSMLERVIEQNLAPMLRKMEAANSPIVGDSSMNGLVLEAPPESTPCRPSSASFVCV